MKAMSATLCAALFTAAALAPSCKRSSPPAKEQSAAAEVGEPTVRLYLLSTLAGALEPCGCSKDQLGGLDHLAAYLSAQKDEASGRLLLSAGPLLYLDPRLEEHHATQDRWKADTIAMAMKEMDLSAWSPGLNDFAGGPKELTAKAKKSGATLLADGLAVADEAARIYEVGGVKVGVVGVSDPKSPLGRYPEGVEAPSGSPAARVAKATEKLKKQGAQLLVAMTALPRGDALRIADAVPDLHVLALGKPSSEGHANTSQPPPQMIGDTLVVETANHGQTVAVVDVFVRGDGDGLLELADAGGVERASKINALSSRILALEARINSWEKGGKVNPKDLADRKRDLTRLRAAREKLRKAPPVPEGSFFRLHVEEVREELGVDSSVREKMRAYYKKVNEHNKVALADLEPPPVPEGKAGYVGIEACSECHAEERKVWDGTAHARAYETLEADFKEYNLECVGCHVTGYGKAGGSTVTHNEPLRDVQCETCHGPGSLHVDAPNKKGLIALRASPQSCVERCHHPPHVSEFEAITKMELVLGPGHGR